MKIKMNKLKGHLIIWGIILSQVLGGLIFGAGFYAIEMSLFIVTCLLSLVWCIGEMINECYSNSGDDNDKN